MAIDTPQTSGVRIFPPLINIAAIAIGFLIQWAVPVGIGGSGFGIVRIAGCIVLAIAAALIVSAAKVMFGAEGRRIRLGHRLLS